MWRRPLWTIILLVASAGVLCTSSAASAGGLLSDLMSSVSLGAVIVGILFIVSFFSFSKPFYRSKSSTIIVTEKATKVVISSIDSKGLQEIFKQILGIRFEVADRFVSAGFFKKTLLRRRQIPVYEPLPQPTKWTKIDFRVWVCREALGIPWRGKRPTIIPPVPLPVILKVTVYSDDFEFYVLEQDLVIDSLFRNKYAVFRLKSLPPVGSRGELFFFIRHQMEVIAAFRVEALVGSDDCVPAQELEDIYLDRDWFKFKKEPNKPPSLAVIFTKKDAQLRLFTLASDGSPWSSIGPTEATLYERNKEIYRDLHRLARVAADGPLNFAKEFGRLAEYGYRLFADVFYAGQTNVPALFYEKYLKSLPERSNVTIIIGKRAETLTVPWGLLYDQKPPFAFFTSPDPSAFWGYRYNLAVRPWYTRGQRTVSSVKPKRVGAAWLKHAESVALEQALKPLVESGELLLDPIRVKDYSIPALADKQFDIIEFFCHGHTKLDGVLPQEESLVIVDNYRKSPQCSRELLMAIGESSDTLVELDGGYATFANLQITLRDQLQGHPLVLLSMCESAQVSSSGGGFVRLFLTRGASAVIGTEGPTLWSLSRAMDTKIIGRLLNGENIRTAFYESRRELAKENMLALIYTLYGDPEARLVKEKCAPVGE